MSLNSDNPNDLKDSHLFQSLTFALGLCMFTGCSAYSYYDYLLEIEKNLLQDEMEQNYPFTYVGRRIASKEDLKDKLFLSGELFLVQYHGQYFCVNKELNLLGTNDFFQIVNNPEDRGTKYQIFEEDIIPFSTILINGRAELTLLEVYEMLEQRNSDYPLFPEYKEIQYPLNENPVEDGINFVSNVNSQEDIRFYQLSNLYVVNQNGNLYLCHENYPRTFSILSNRNDELSTFTFSLLDGDVSKWQVQKLSSILEKAGFSSLEHSSHSLIAWYQLLDTAIHILGGIDFAPTYESHQGFTKAQLQFANQYLSYGENYLDDYCMDPNESPSIYSLEDVSIVSLGNQQFVLATSVTYDETSNRYVIAPLQSSTRELSKLYVSTPVTTIPFSAMFDIPDVDSHQATYFYTIFRDFLVKNGPNFFSSFEQSNENCFDVSSTLFDLGKKLSLTLTYQE